MKIIKPLALLCLLVLTVLSLVHFAPPDWDFSSMAAMNVDRAFEFALPYLLMNGVQYGPGAIFTYGPWGMLFTGFATNNYLGLVWLFNIAWILCIFSALWLYLQKAPSAQSMILVWIGCTLLPLLWATGQNEAYFIFPVLFVAFTYFKADDGEWSPASFRDGTSLARYVTMFATAVLLGWGALAKFNIFLAAVAIFGLILAVDVWKRRLPILPTAFTVSLLTAWTTAGQRLANLPVWISASLNLSSSYTDAMAKGFLRPFTVPAVIVFYLGVSLVVAAGFVRYTLRKEQRGYLPLFLFLALDSVLAVKHAMGNQMEQSIGELLVLIWFLAVDLTTDHTRERLMNSPESWFSWATWLSKPLAVGSLLAGASACLAYVASTVTFPLKPVVSTPQIQITRNLQALSHPATLLSDNTWPSLLAEAHQLAPLGNEFQGNTIDVYPQHTPLGIGREGMPYAPRPAYLSLNAHTLRLANANAQYLEGPNAPDVVLFEVLPPYFSVNNRYPSTADGPSWPILWADYDLVGFSGELAVLKKRNDAPQPITRPITESTLELNQSMPLPRSPSGLLWMKIDVERSLFGQFVNAIFRSPQIFVTIRTVDHQNRTYQIVPELGKAGFLISPIVDNTVSFAEVARRLAPDPRDIVRSIKITSPDAPPGFWKNEIKVQLSELSLPAVDPPALPPDAQRVMSFHELMHNANSCIFPPALQELNATGKAVLFFHAPCQSELAVPPGDHTLALEFGLQDDSFTGPIKTDGVVAAITAVDANGSVLHGWSRTLDPVHNVQDRGTQEMTVTWSENTVSRVIIQFGPGPKDDPAYDHSYIESVLVSK